MNVLTASDVSIEDGTPLLLREGESDDNLAEALVAHFPDVALHASEALALDSAVGALFVTSKRVVWIGDRAAAHVGYGWDTSRVTLHAISRDESAFPRPCLYCQVDSDGVSEIRFVPSDPDQLQAIFDAFSRSAELNPDDDDDDEADGDDDGWVFDEDEVANGARAAEIAAHLDSVLRVSPALLPVAGQFDDADEADELL